MMMTPVLQDNPNVVAVSLRTIPDFKTIWRCERAARKGNFRILWINSKIGENNK